MPVITVRNLHRTGRVGNQLFLYAFAKAYARAHNCDFQVPKEWWGRRVFANVNEEWVTHYNLPQTVLDNRPRKTLGYFFGKKDLDIYVYAQHQKYLDFYSRADIREWFKFKPEFESFFPWTGSNVAHKRRGDYLTTYHNKYCSITSESYVRAIEKFHVPQPIFSVEEGWRPEDPELAKQGLGWIQDFLLLRDAAHLLRANSSFSVWAGWLGDGKVYSPVVGNKVGWADVEFVEGNHSNTAAGFSNQSDLHLKET